MPVVSLPVTRPAGMMLIIATAAMQEQPALILKQIGLEPHTVSDPYTALVELLAAKIPYRGAVISLQSVYREEIAVIGTLKRRLPQLEIWLAHTDNRQAALAEAMRLGADGLLGEEGLHRIASPSAAPESEIAVPPQSEPMVSAPLQVPIPAPESDPEHAEATDEDHAAVSEPVLTADELRALLQEQPSMPPTSGSEN